MQAERIPAVIPSPSGGAPRSEGVHVSGLIRAMAGEYGFLKKEWVEDLSLVEVHGESEIWWAGLDDVSRLRMSMGLAWEQWYLPNLGYVIHQPGELCLQGIYMTHDGESLDAVVTERRTHYRMALHECKLTYKSLNTVGDFQYPSRASLKSNWMWLMQTKSYAKALDCLVVYLHILYVCGDYSFPIQPLLHVWRIEYEPWEIEEAWELILDYFRDRKLKDPSLVAALGSRAPLVGGSSIGGSVLL